ncbi:transposase [Streptomyces sp. NPDC094034]|uniref:transposase n=1 Tax=Streptomyces sp. NPDC094034 TaxID=3155309 RepID=UPI00332FA453
MATEHRRRVVPDELWEIARPLLPTPKLRYENGVRQNLDHSDVFAAIVYVRGSGRTWRELPTDFGVSRTTAQHRFRVWSADGVWNRLHRAVLAASDSEETLRIAAALRAAAPSTSDPCSHRGPSRRT